MLPAVLASNVARSNALAVASQFGFFTLVLVGAFLLVRKLVRGFQKNGYMNSFGTNTVKGRATQYATQLHQAMISTPSWISWMGDGTDEQRIFSTAHEIQQDKEVELVDVQQAYKTMYNRDLVTDLTSELDSSDFNKFRRIVNQGLQGLEAPSMLVVSRATTVYDKNLRPMSQAKANTKIGTSYETLITAQGTFDVFYYNGQPRLVKSQDVKHIPHAA